MDIINRQTFFKLPLIFIVVFFISYFSMKLGLIISSDIPKNYFPNIILSSFILIPTPLLLFFIVVIFCCQKYRLHLVSDSGLIVGLIGFIFSLLYFGFTLLKFKLDKTIVIYLYQISKTSDLILWVQIFYAISLIIVHILYVFVLYFLFFLLTKKNVINRQIFVLEGSAGRQIYACIYSILLLFFINLIFANVTLNLLPINITSEESDYISLLFLFLIILLSYYFIFYFAVRNSFKKIDSSIKFVKMFISVLIVFILILIVPLFNLKDVLFLIFWNLFSKDSLINMLVFSTLLHFILCFLISRFSVRIIYQ